MKKVICTGCLFILVYAVANATIINVPADQPTIQEGIDIAVDGDTVLVDEGSYYENINFLGKKIVVTSYYYFSGDSTYINSTIIDGSYPINPDSGSVVVFASGEDSLSVISGFTIQNGSGTQCSGRFGGGVYCYHTSPLITHNIIMGNTAFKGGAIYTENLGNAPALNISDNEIKWNSATAFGGGIYIDLGSAIIADNLISGNCACCGGGIASQFGWENSIVITGNKILNNQTVEGNGGGFWMDYGGTIIEFKYNLVCNNIGGGIVVLDYDFSSDIYLINNTICNNTCEGVHLAVGSFEAINNIISYNNIGFDAWAFNQYQINYNDVWNNPNGDYVNCEPGIANISSDPLFVDGVPFNYHLTQDSPCIDTGDPSSPLDPDGTIADMGA
ncbi:MAG: right-handed parallel beta-helix repeat-containing protein, partial [Candidatus Cloacimonetes bacterium]|nr:right-handed parallel beta-helix repeat-containing protein [Candidatus Cloacimonadota bacterium]